MPFPKSKSLGFIVLFFLGPSLGHGRAENPAEPAPRQSQPPAAITLTKTDLGTILRPGITADEVMARLGGPLSTNQYGGDNIEWVYTITPFPADPPMAGTYVYAVNLIITNGHLARWRYSYFNPPKKSTVIRSEPLAIGSDTYSWIRVFIVRSNAAAGWKFVDTPEFPKLGYVAPQPDLLLSGILAAAIEERSVSTQGGEARTNWAVNISLNSSEAERLGKFTADHVGDKVLICIGDVPAIAPTISSPISGGVLSVNSANESKVEAFKRELTSHGKH